MKTTNRLSILIAIVLFSVSSFSFGQKIHEITLFVNTAALDRDNTDETCNFKQDAGIMNKDYTIEASIGDIIIWKGESTSSESVIVNITAINHEGGKNVFDQNKLDGNGQVPELVIGTVIKGAPGDVDKYKISFKVSNKSGTFHIDPKIKIIGGS